MRERLLIVGAGDFGREVLGWALQVPPEKRTWEVGGFLDNRPHMLDDYNLPASILGAPECHVYEAHDRVVVAILDPVERRAMVQLLTNRGVQFTTLIHPSATLGLNSTFGQGCIICPNTHITTGVKIGDHVIIDYHAGIGHDVQIGSYCTLSPGAGIMGGGILEEGAGLGLFATLVPAAHIETGAVVGAGSMVLKRVSAHTTVVGVPARKLLNRPAGGDRQN